MQRAEKTLCIFLERIFVSDICRNKVLFKWDNFFAGLWPMTAVLAIYFQDITSSYALTMSVWFVSGGVGDSDRSFFG